MKCYVVVSGLVWLLFPTVSMCQVPDYATHSANEPPRRPRLFDVDITDKRGDDGAKKEITDFELSFKPEYAKHRPLDSEVIAEMKRQNLATDGPIADVMFNVIRKQLHRRNVERANSFFGKSALGAVFKGVPKSNETKPETGGFDLSGGFKMDERLRKVPPQFRSSAVLNKSSGLDSSFFKPNNFGTSAKAADPSSTLRKRVTAPDEIDKKIRKAQQQIKEVEAIKAKHKRFVMSLIAKIDDVPRFKPVPAPFQPAGYLLPKNIRLIEATKKYNKWEKERAADAAARKVEYRRELTKLEGDADRLIQDLKKRIQKLRGQQAIASQGRSSRSIKAWTGESDSQPAYEIPQNRPRRREARE